MSVAIDRAQANLSEDDDRLLRTWGLVQRAVGRRRILAMFLGVGRVHYNSRRALPAGDDRLRFSTNAKERAESCSRLIITWFTVATSSCIVKSSSACLKTRNSGWWWVVTSCPHPLRIAPSLLKINCTDLEPQSVGEVQRTCRHWCVNGPFMHKRSLQSGGCSLYWHPWPGSILQKTAFFHKMCSWQLQQLPLTSWPNCSARRWLPTFIVHREGLDQNHRSLVSVQQV